MGMSKQSRERHGKFLRRNLRRYSRLIDEIKAINFPIPSENVVIDITDVKHGIDSFKGDLDIRDYAVNIAPPFPVMFFEINDYSIPIQDPENAAGINNVKLNIGVWMDCPKTSESDPRRTWLLSGCLITRVRIPSRDFRQEPIAFQVWVDSSGEMSNVEFIDSQSLELLDISKVGGLAKEMTYKIMAISLKAISLMNCRNIELVDHQPDPIISRQYQQHFGQPLTTYKTLRIKPIGKRYESNTESKEYQGLMPLHLRRGNFAHYTEDAPLFGKYTGTFWRPATAVGESKNGIVVKDYEITQ